MGGCVVEAREDLSLGGEGWCFWRLKPPGACQPVHASLPGCLLCLLLAGGALKPGKEEIGPELKMGRKTADNKSFGHQVNSVYSYGRHFGGRGFLPQPDALSTTFSCGRETLHLLVLHAGRTSSCTLDRWKGRSNRRFPHKGRSTCMLQSHTRPQVNWG